jgi:hypothetical protein
MCYNKNMTQVLAKKKKKNHKKNLKKSELEKIKSQIWGSRAIPFWPLRVIGQATLGQAWCDQN